MKSGILILALASFSLNLSHVIQGQTVKPALRNNTKVLKSIALRGQLLRGSVRSAIPIIEEIPERPTSPVVYKMSAPFLMPPSPWGPWQYCPGTSFVYKASVKVGRMRTSTADNNFSFDSRGLRGMILNCHNMAEVGTHITSIVLGVNAVASCGNGIARGVQVMSVPDQGCQDNYGIVNFKLFCPGKDVEEVIAYNGTGRNIGEWTRPLICPEHSAVCGAREAYSTWENMFALGNGCFRDWKSTGIDGLEVACCTIDDPAFVCAAEASWDLVINCTSEKCLYESKEGLFYLPTDPPELPAEFEGLGYTKKTAIETLLDNFEGSIGEDFEAYYFYEILREAALTQKSKKDFVVGCNGLRYEQIVLTCGFYEVRSEFYRCI